MIRALTFAALATLALARTAPAGPVTLYSFTGHDTTDGLTFSGFFSYDPDTPGIRTASGLSFGTGPGNQFAITKVSPSPTGAVTTTVSGPAEFHYDKGHAGGGFEFDVVSLPNPSVSQAFLRLTAPGPLTLPADLSRSFIFGSAYATSGGVTFIDNGVIDSVILSSPEPSTFAGAALAALAGLGYARRRMRAG